MCFSYIANVPTLQIGKADDTRERNLRTFRAISEQYDVKT